MDMMNCKIGVPVKILSKSTGQDIEDLNGAREGRISKVEEDYDVFELMVTVSMVEDGEYCRQDFSFIPSDLEPLWGDTQHG